MTHILTSRWMFFYALDLISRRFCPLVPDRAAARLQPTITSMFENYRSVKKGAPKQKVSHEVASW